MRKQNLEVPAGRIESESREFSVVASTDLRTPEAFGAVVVRTVNGYPVRISDVARVEIGAAAERSAVRFKGRSAVALGVIKQATANPLELSRALSAALPRIASELPDGMTANISYDSSVFIDRSIASVFKTIGEAILLVLAIIFFFLRNLRATLIPLVTIPVSLIGSFAIMFVLGFSINTLTNFSRWPARQPTDRGVPRPMRQGRASGGFLRRFPFFWPASVLVQCRRAACLPRLVGVPG